MSHRPTEEISFSSFDDSTPRAIEHAIPATIKRPVSKIPRGTALAHKASQKLSSIHFRDEGEEEFDNVVSEAAEYGRVQFWDQRFLEDPDPYDWYHPYIYFRDVILEHIPTDRRVMVAGVGSSTMTEDMVEDGYTDVVAQDISRVAIAQLRIRNKGVPGLTYATCNMTDSDLPEHSFFAIVDKGLLDSLLCTPNGNKEVQQYVTEVERLLDSEAGVFIVISHMGPEDMLPLIEQYDLDEPYYTPWFTDVCAVVKPPQFEGEELNPDNPDHLYWCYVATIDPSMARKKQGAIDKKAKRDRKRDKNFKKPTVKAPNL